jgi:deoxyribonuclease V
VIPLKVLQLHHWDVTPREATEIQNQMKSRIILENGSELKNISKIAGADVSYDKSTNTVYAAVIVFSFPELVLLEENHASQEASFPYVPGLLVFREGPTLIKAFEETNQEPDIIIFDGQGIAHPRGIGIATHMGILLDKPSIGCAKTVLIGDFEEPEKTADSYTPLVKNGVQLGVALRTKDRVEPVFVSIGHKIDLPTAIDIVMKCSRGYRLPEPIRQTHILSNRLREEKKEEEPTLF